MFVINKQLPARLEGSHTQSMMSTFMNRNCNKPLFFGRNVNQFQKAIMTY